MSKRRRRNHCIQIQLVLLAVIVILQGGGRWRTREPKYRKLDSWLESLIEREVNCCQSWICTRCTFFALQAIVAWQYASRFFKRIPVKRFFPPCSEWVMTNTIDIIVEFLKRLDQFSPFENSDLLLHGEYRACLISCKLTLDLTIARLWRKLHFFRADEVAFPWGRCWWPEMQVCQIEIGGLQTLWKRFYGSNLFQFQRNPFPGVGGRWVRRLWPKHRSDGGV